MCLSFLSILFFRVFHINFPVYAECSAHNLTNNCQLSARTNSFNVAKSIKPPAKPIRRVSQIARGNSHNS